MTIPQAQTVSNVPIWPALVVPVLTLKVGKLRPHAEYLFDDSELILVLPAATSETHVKGTWHITANGHDEIYSGELRVEVGPLVDLTKSMRSLLKLDSH